ncbi:hypothetical protein KFE96_03705 [Kordiimonas sp. SCSIO 12603]|uniref:hypothetical protein n=1 Tax=Kordiimonas sp. SCSIO 12603 TaxID=2829596 RepID=UPI0021053A06|nr:hypothetical protein [Kordiimonas sp. SCSIO 12603]UTW59425.1 hypothetical protein KFE96_03705 [Kordiimonas sp. SCSIO 12603]
MTQVITELTTEELNLVGGGGEDLDPIEVFTTFFNAFNPFSGLGGVGSGGNSERDYFIRIDIDVAGIEIDVAL